MAACSNGFNYRLNAFQIEHALLNTLHISLRRRRGTLALGRRRGNALPDSPLHATNTRNYGATDRPSAVEQLRFKRRHGNQRTAALMSSPPTSSTATTNTNALTFYCHVIVDQSDCWDRRGTEAKTTSCSHVPTAAVPVQRPQLVAPNHVNGEEAANGVNDGIAARVCFYSHRSFL